MLEKNQFTQGAIGMSFVILALFPHSIGACVGVVAAVILLLGERYLEVRRVDELAKRDDAIEEKIQALKDKLDALVLSKGFGR